MPDSTCSGCTDPEALNYSEDATIDDGTCVYDSGPRYVGPRYVDLRYRDPRYGNPRDGYRIFVLETSQKKGVGAICG